MTEPPAATPAQVDDASSLHTEASDAETRVAKELARAVLDVEGVVRLEPSMRDLVRRADPLQLLKDRRPHKPDGVAVATFAAITDVTVDLAVTAPHQALTTAQRVQSTVRAVLLAHELEPGQVAVNVLAIEYDDSGQLTQP